MKISMPCWVVIGNITQNKVQGSPPPQNQHNIGGYVKTEPRSSVVLDAWLVNDVSQGQLYAQLNKPSHAGCLKWISMVLSRKKSTCLTHRTLFLGPSVHFIEDNTRTQFYQSTTKYVKFDEVQARYMILIDSWGMRRGKQWKFILVCTSHNATTITCAPTSTLLPT